MNLARLLATLAAFALSAFYIQESQENPAVRPATRRGVWMDLHQACLERAKRGNVDLLFVGDSITQGWGDNPVWKRFYGERNAANFGIGGDRTEHVLWRLDHGEIDGIKPKVVVLMIGTNNMNVNTPAEIAEGVAAVVDRLKSKLPETKVLLLGIFPRGDKDAPVRDHLKEANDRIAKLADGKRVVYLDIGKSFLDERGGLSREIMPDLLHLSRRGYRIWADAMEPTLWRMLEEK